ncbi:MAG TPA: hypothetical protein VKZ63_13005, partial [Kofleriaceae bacterium]|nr:hypothetical protein [Kofleriaceae bacterium]
MSVRLATRAIAIMVLALALVGVGASAVAAQPAADPHAGHAHGPGEHGGAQAQPQRAADAGDHAEPVGFQNSRIAALFFWIFAGLTLGGALFVITRKNLI